MDAKGVRSRGGAACASGVFAIPCRLCESSIPKPVQGSKSTPIPCAAGRSPRRRTGNGRAHAASQRSGRSRLQWTRWCGRNSVARGQARLSAEPPSVRHALCVRAQSVPPCWGHRPCKHLFETNVCLEPTDGGRGQWRSFGRMLASARTRRYRVSRVLKSTPFDDAPCGGARLSDMLAKTGASRPTDLGQVAGQAWTTRMPTADNRGRAPSSGTQRKTGPLGMRDRDCLSKDGQRVQSSWATF
jgi:hypothetical protein